MATAQPPRFLKGCARRKNLPGNQQRSGRARNIRAAEISLRFVFGIFIEMTLDIVKQQSKKQSVDAHDVLAVYTDYLQNTKNIQNFAGKITFNKKNLIG